jgi:hypothetical protein
MVRSRAGRNLSRVYRKILDTLNPYPHNQEKKNIYVYFITLCFETLNQQDGLSPSEGWLLFLQYASGVGFGNTPQCENKPVASLVCFSLFLCNIQLF